LIQNYYVYITQKSINLMIPWFIQNSFIYIYQGNKEKYYSLASPRFSLFNKNDFIILFDRFPLLFYLFIRNALFLFPGVCTAILPLKRNLLLAIVGNSIVSFGRQIKLHLLCLSLLAYIVLKRRRADFSILWFELFSIVFFSISYVKFLITLWESLSRKSVNP
jgi:hypothetical protein